MSTLVDDEAAEEATHPSNVIKQARAVKLAQKNARNLRADQDLINAGHGKFYTTLSVYCPLTEFRRTRSKSQGS